MAISIKLKINQIKSLQRYLRTKNISLAILEKIDANYFTETESNFLIILPSKGKLIIYTSPLNIENYKKSKFYTLLSYEKFFKFKLKGKIVGLNYALTTMRTASNIKTKKKDISGFISNLRQIKTMQEIKDIRTSCDIACNILRKAIKKINKTLFSEIEIKRYIESEAFKQDCTLSFTPVVASGKNATIPHALVTNKKLRRGFLIIDFGVKYKGYCSDITRTVVIGKPTKKEIAIYEMVLQVQKESIKKIKTSFGKKMNILDKYARELFGNSKKYFTHSLGHGFGLEIHEQPWVSYNSKNIIQENQVLTIEPGYYDTKNSIGIRIEDDILVKNKDFEVLTSKLSRKLIIIKS
jgi:Xaa-Pro aminopeptidase